MCLKAKEKLLKCAHEKIFEFISLYLYLDIDECSRDRRLCSQGRCENTDGSFLCICQAGYMANEQGTDCTGMYHDVARISNS